MVKIILSLLFSLAFKANMNAQCEVSEDSLMRIKGKWKKDTDANMVPGKNLTHIINRIDKISKLFQLAHPQPMGTTAEWRRGMFGTPLVDDGPAAYYFSSLFREWYCDKNINQIMLEGETGNWGEVWINRLGNFFYDNIRLKEVQVNNSDVYILPQTNSEWNGHLMYDEPSEFFGSRTIILTHNNRLPWKTITQAQYLFSLKAVWQNKKDKGAEGYADQIADLDKSIKEWRDNKDIKPADKKEIITSLEKGKEDYKKAEAEYVERITSEYAKKIAVIDDYILQHKEELAKPAIINFLETGHDDFNGSFSEIKKGGNMLVILDPGYFNKNLPDYVPQLMVLVWRWRKDNPGLHFQKQIEENFQVEKLMDMIDK